MLFLTLILFFGAETVFSDDPAEREATLEKNRLLGIDAIHDVKIDKDTIITRNLKLDQKKAAKNAIQKDTTDRDPDWSYSAIPPSLTDYVTDFKRNMTACLRETQPEGPTPVRGGPSPVHSECLIACVLRRNQVIDHGKINKGNLLSLVGKFYAKDTKLMKKLEKNLDRCVEMSLRHRDDQCKMAAKFNDCTNDLMASNKHKLVVNY